MNVNGSSTDPDTMDAVHALRSRGIDNGEELLAYGTPAEILAACRRWDGRPGVGPGLLARWIRSQQFPEPEPTPAPAANKRAELRARFEAYARRFPPGSIAEPHRRLIERRWPDDVERALELGQDLCDGDMIVADAIYPQLIAECDRCDFEAAYPVRGLHVLGAQLEPVPDPEEAVF
jgi:hypothetical protein